MAAATLALLVPVTSTTLATAAPIGTSTIADLPGAVTDLTATPGDTTVALSWTAALPDSHGPITDYAIETQPGGAIVHAGTATSDVVTDLTNGTAYTFTVTASDGVDSGPGTTTGPVTPFAPPGAPASVSATAGHASATVSWQPAAVGTYQISGYVIQASPGGQTVSADATATQVVVTGLDNGTAYTFAVAATDGTHLGAVATSNSVVPTRWSTALSIARRYATVRYGATEVLSGRLVIAGTTTGIAGQSIRLYTRRHGTVSWVYVATATTTSTGSWSLTHKPPYNSDYTARFAVTALYAAAASPNVAVTVVPVLTAVVRPSQMQLGHTATISGSLRPAHSGQLIYLQRYYTLAWHNVASTKLSSTGTFGFYVKPASTATWLYRIYKPADADHASVVTGTLRLVTYKIGISSIHYDAAGNDFYNLNDEYALIHNYGTNSVNLSGWSLDAGDTGQRFTLPAYSLRPGTSVAVRTGHGTTGGASIYLNRNAPIWNNTGDTGTLYNPLGTIISRYKYLTG